jgi:pimeloyl-ACP methyl ester carboxylesterase
MATYVLVHGGWTGGWVWQEVGRHLQQAGHEVYRPTLTGLGERVHLASPEIGLETHIQDVANLIMFEDLSDVILVGYSYSGIVVTGVADRMADRLSQLVYFDAFVPEADQTMADIVGPDVMQGLRDAANTYGDGWRFPHYPPDADRRTPHPLKPNLEPLILQNPAAKAIPRTFIYCTVISDPPPPILSPIVAKAQEIKNDPRWRYYELEAGHGDFWATHPREAAELLLKLV